ncbi:MAG: heme ABC transporter ATP-binding protein [Alphaproteobacteria bacterium]|nr:heme ABC transporter ATP-binding protein [Alphaproteobacteria bacterium]
MLAACNLGIRRGDRTVLDRVDVAIVPGEVVGIVGPNGAGKSTLIAALAGELRPAAGAVAIDGTPIGALDADARARRLAVVPQATRLDFAFTARQVVELGRYPHRGRGRRQEDRRAVDAALVQADVMALAGRAFTTLSGGEQQRCMLARALAQIDGETAQARYLLADEPTASLDINHQASCLTVMRALAARGVGVLCALHDLNLAALYVDRLIVLSEGRVAADARPAEALAPDLVRRVFQADMLRIDHPALGVPQFLGLGPASPPGAHPGL